MSLAFLKTILRSASVRYQTEIRNYVWTLGLVTNFSGHLHLVVQMLQSPLYSHVSTYFEICYCEDYSITIPSVIFRWFSVYYIQKLKHEESTKGIQCIVFTTAAM